MGGQGMERRKSTKILRGWCGAWAHRAVLAQATPVCTSGECSIAGARRMLGFYTAGGGVRAWLTYFRPLGLQASQCCA